MPILGIIASSNQTGRAGGPTGAYDALATVIAPSAGLATITFNGIPATGYSHLQLRCVLQDDRALYGLDQLRVQVGNGSVDTGSTSYAYHYLRADGSTVTAYGAATSSGDNGSWQINGAVGTNVSPTSWGAIIIDIVDYSATDRYKTMRAFSGNDLNGSGPAGVPGRVALGSAVWLGANGLLPVTAITLAPENATKFLEYSRVSLYGVK